MLQGYSLLVSPVLAWTGPGLGWTRTSSSLLFSHFIIELFLGQARILQSY
jgi:hypothetical protein